MSSEHQPLGVTRAPQGFSIHTANIGVKDDSTDFCVVVSDVPADAAGVYTRSRFAGPSVALSRAATADLAARGVVVVSKNANVANGPQGLADAVELQTRVADHLGLSAGELVVASTGVIGRPYPMDVIRAGVDAIALPLPSADAEAFERAAAAIMTTDTHSKLVSVTVRTSHGGEATIVGIATGVGMIEPNMATLLTFFFTDALVPGPQLDATFRSVIDVTYNALSIDTDTSTSDTAVIFANGLAGTVDHAEFHEALHRVALDLVLMIAADGEGASKVITAVVGGARDVAQAKLVAKAIVNSPLVKTAVHGADPNWGRIVMAVGKCDTETDIDPDVVRVWIGDTEMYPGAADPVVAQAALETAAAHMGGDRVLLRVDLGIGDGRFSAYGCDLTDGYIRINADYTT